MGAKRTNEAHYKTSALNSYSTRFRGTNTFVPVRPPASAGAPWGKLAEKH